MFKTLKMLSLLTVACASTSLAQAPRVQDPMRPLVVAGPTDAVPEAEAGLKLTAVLVSDSRRIALINGRFYRVGDRVNGEEITRIEPGSIRIMRGGKQVLVSVQNGRPATSDTDGDQDQ